MKTVNVSRAPSHSRRRRPTHVKVEQYDFDKLGLTYQPPVTPRVVPPPLPVMVLLKV